MTLIDTNILLDVASRDQHWSEWSVTQLETASVDGPLIINDIIYAELSVRYDRKEDVDDFLEVAEIAVAPMPRAALFLAGRRSHNTEGQAVRGLECCQTFS